MVTTEDVQRQVAVTLVITVEEPAFLLAVQRIVGRIQDVGEPAKAVVLDLVERWSTTDLCWISSSVALWQVHVLNIREDEPAARGYVPWQT